MGCYYSCHNFKGGSTYGCQESRESTQNGQIATLKQHTSNAGACHMRNIVYVPADKEESNIIFVVFRKFEIQRSFR